MKKKSLITTLALTGGLLSLGLCLTSCDLSQNNTTTQAPISETTPALPNPIDETTPSEIQETTPTQETNPTDNTTPSNQEGTLKQRLLSSNSENEIINILGEYSLEEIELALTDEEVQNKITLSDQFNNLQVILSSVNDTLKQISNNVASSKTVAEEDYNYIEFDVVKKYYYSFDATTLEDYNVNMNSGVLTLTSNSSSGTSHSSGTSTSTGTSVSWGSSSSTGTSSSSGTSSSTGTSEGVSFIGTASPNYSHGWGSNSSTGTSTSDSSSNSFSQGSSSGTSTSEGYGFNQGTSTSTGFSRSYSNTTTLHFYNISNVDISTYSYEDISRIYKTVKSVLVNDDNKLTLQSFNFDKLQLVESDEVYIKNIYSEGRGSNQGTSTFTETEDSRYSEDSTSSGASQSSSNSSSSNSTSSLAGTSESYTSGEGSSSGASTSISQSEYSYYSIYEMEGTNDLTLHFKLEFDDTVSLEDMLNLINISSSSFTINLTNIYYK